MNPEFERQQKQVLSLLELLAKQARKLKATLVFIGGSAVHMRLREPKRLSIDLDLYFDGKSEELLAVLAPGYSLTQRPVQRGDLFSFYKAAKDQTIVKIDISRFSLVENGKPFSVLSIKSGDLEFRVRVASPDFLLASKLCSLAVGTVGRKPDKRDFVMNYLKDIFDTNCLLDENPFSKKAISLFKGISDSQNKIRNTNYSNAQVIESAEKTIQSMINAESIKGALQSFNQYLFQTNLSKPRFYELQYRALACMKALELNSPTLFTKIEKIAQTDYTNRKTISAFELALLEKGLDENHLHELKILAPKAIIYLYAFHNPTKLKSTNKKIINSPTSAMQAL